MAVDPEDLDSHYGLSQCYTRLGQDAPDDAKEEPEPVTAERLLALGTVVANAKEPDAKRIAEAAQAWPRPDDAGPPAARSESAETAAVTRIVRSSSSGIPRREE